MNPLDQLYNKLNAEGISKEQSEIAVKVIIQWMYEQYPIMAAVSDIWLKTNGFENKDQ